ncbi:DUF5677 domain-containing protein [Lacipirellula sp.]|uniref:DUF5677 domain-containing protein n=1 Tax=Lacipirellula sp. TaxID=2691419 RepID=UPI003D0A94FA
MPHVDTQACLLKAEPLIQLGDADSLRYASLQLRMGIEYLFYELVPLYKQELPDDILSAGWQPQRILDAILECDPDANQDSRLAFGQAGENGVTNWADTILEAKAPNKQLLKKHYHRLGFYLHAPVDMVAPKLEKWRIDLEKASSALSEFKVGQALSNFRELVDIPCNCCGRTVYRNKRGVEATGEMRCLNPECRAIYDVRFEGDAAHFQLRQESFNCQRCGTTNFIPTSAIGEGAVLICDECEQRVVVRSTFRLQPFDAEPPDPESMSDVELLAFQAKLGNSVIHKLKQTQAVGDVGTAIDAMYSRIVQSGSTLLMLHSDAKEHDWSFDGNSILRTIYDVSLQALYIFHDPNESETLSRRYIDFSAVERKRFTLLFDKQANDFSRRMSRSAKRPAVEAAIDAEYQRVMRKYGYDKLKEPPKNWYKGSLRDLAAKVGYEDEYELLQKQLSGVVHSTYDGVRGMPRYEDAHLVSLYWTFAFRVLDKIAQYIGIQLDDTERLMLHRAKKNIFNS